MSLKHGAFLILLLANCALCSPRCVFELCVVHYHMNFPVTTMISIGRIGSVKKGSLNAAGSLCLHHISCIVEVLVPVSSTLFGGVCCKFLVHQSLPMGVIIYQDAKIKIR